MCFLFFVVFDAEARTLSLTHASKGFTTELRPGMVVLNDKRSMVEKCHGVTVLVLKGLFTRRCSPRGAASRKSLSAGGSDPSPGGVQPAASRTQGFPMIPHCDHSSPQDRGGRHIGGPARALVPIPLCQVWSTARFALFPGGCGEARPPTPRPALCPVAARLPRLGAGSRPLSRRTPPARQV